MIITTSKPINATINNVDIHKNKIIETEEIAFDLKIEDTGLHIVSIQPLTAFKNILYTSNDEYISKSICDMISYDYNNIIKLLKDAKVNIEFDNSCLRILKIELSEMGFIEIEIYNYYRYYKIPSNDKAKEILRNRINELIKSLSNEAKAFEHKVKEWKNKLSELNK